MIIKDKLIHPYEINWDDTFTVLENGVAIDAKTREEKPKQTTLGYFTTLEMTLLFICKRLTEKSFEVATVKEVVERYEQIWLDIKNTIKI